MTSNVAPLTVNDVFATIPRTVAIEVAIVEATLFSMDAVQSAITVREDDVANPSSELATVLLVMRSSD